MLHILEHTLSHTIEDSVKLLPFLFFTYLLMELLEHTTGGKVQNKIKDAGESGGVPVCGNGASLRGASPFEMCFLRMHHTSGMCVYG